MTILDKLSVVFNPAEQKKIAFLFVGILLLSLSEVAGVASIAPFMAIVSKPEIIHENVFLNAVYSYFGFTTVSQFQIGMGALVLGVLIISNSYAAFMTWQIIRFSKKQGHHLAVRLFSNYLTQPYLFFLNRNTADLGKNVLSEVERSVNGVILPGMQVLSKFVVTIFLCSFLLYLNPMLSISVIIVFGGAYALIFKLARHRLHQLGVVSTKVIFRRFKIANEAMSGIKDLKLHGSEQEFVNRFSKPSEAHANISSRSAMISLLPRYALEITAFGGIIALVCYSISSGKNSGQIIPLISIYVLAGYKLLPALQQIYVNVTTIRYNLPALEILITDLPHSKGKKNFQQQKNEMLHFEKLLQVVSLRFYYPGVEEPVLDDVNLKIIPNTTIGLVGVTGSGKTTLIDILLGLLLPESGKITVDGTEITEQNFPAWQQYIGYVPQEIYLIDDTIERNIAFAIPDDTIDMDKVIEAAKLAELDSFIQTLPEQYQTQVGERGVRLSGGQRQRIGIARALYRNPKVLVLDEATSALDGITENIVMDAIHNLFHKKTIIMIAHRLSTVKECDVIHMMDKGRIIDSGTYNELMMKNEQFRKMANLKELAPKMHGGRRCR